MKRFLILVIAFLFMLLSSALADNTVYALKNSKLYEVGKNINPGNYSLEFDEKDSLKLAVITVGSDLKYTPGRDAVLIKDGQFHEYSIDKDNPSQVLNLVEGNKLFVNAGSPRLVPANGTEDAPTASTSTQKKLSPEEVKRIINKAPYVSSKNIVIDSPDGMDFYTYLGNGIIMSNRSGDCFDMVVCDDEPIVDHYKIMPLKAGKGKIEYTINMKKRIVVNVTVKDSALAPSDPVSPGDASVVRAIKDVNIRADASTSSKRVGAIKKGDKLTVVSAFYKPEWHQVLYKGKICYVSAKYVDLE